MNKNIESMIEQVEHAYDLTFDGKENDKYRFENSNYVGLLKESVMRLLIRYATHDQLVCKDDEPDEHIIMRANFILRDNAYFMCGDLTKITWIPKTESE